MADVSAVQNHFPTASETYENNLSSSIGALEEIVPVNSANEYDDGDVVVLTVEPGTANEATFTGVKASLPDRFVDCVWTEGNLGVGHASGATVVDYDSATHLNIITKALKMFANQNGTLKATAIATALGVGAATDIVNPSGAITPYAGITAPTGWLLCYGQDVSRVTYESLFNAISPVIGTVTITIASPGVATLVGHGLATGDPVHLTTTGALPTGLTSLSQYFAIAVDANTFRFATSRANALAGTAINTTGAQSGVHTIRRNTFGVGNGSSTFTLPDLRGRVIAGLDNMGGVSADRLTENSQTVNGLNGDVFGNVGGSEVHVLTTAQMPSHTHANNWALFMPSGTGSFVLNDRGGDRVLVSDNAAHGTNGENLGGNLTLSQGNSTAHNNIQPTMILNYLIKT